MEADDVEHLDVLATFDDQPFDHIPAVQIDAPAGQVGQIPARWRWGGPAATLTVQGTAAGQDAADRAFAGHVVPALLHQDAADGGGAVLAEVAVVFEVPAERENLFLQVGVGGIGGPPAAPGPVGPVGAVQTLAAGAGQPALDGGQTDAEALGSLALGQARADRLHQLATQDFGDVFWPCGGLPGFFLHSSGDLR